MHIIYADRPDHLDHLDHLDHVNHLDHHHLTSDHPTNQIPVQPSQVKYSSRAQYIPVQPVILLNVVKSVTLSSLSETAEFTLSCIFINKKIKQNSGKVREI